MTGADLAAGAEHDIAGCARSLRHPTAASLLSVIAGLEQAIEKLRSFHDAGRDGFEPQEEEMARASLLALRTEFRSLRRMLRQVGSLVPPGERDALPGQAGYAPESSIR